MEKAYKYRLYPNAAQRAQIGVTADCARWVYNKCLETRIAACGSGAKAPSKYDLIKMVPGWKRGNPWLAEADAIALQSACEHLDAAYRSFFARVQKGGCKPGFPRFKSKRTARRRYRTKNVGGGIAVLDAKHLKLPKLGRVRCAVSKAPEGRILSATVEHAPSGRYYVSVLCTDVPEPHMPAGPVELMGVDAGVHDLAVRSDGVRVPNPKNLARSERKLAREQRRLSRKVGARKGERTSRNFEKQRRKVARAHERVVDQRRDAIHKATTAAVRESQAVAVEDLNVAGMMRNRKSAKSVADASMGEMIRQLEYKCAWHGREFVKVGRLYPSTQLCSSCGAKAGPSGFEGLKVREWECPECGALHGPRPQRRAQHRRRGQEGPGR